jgi:acetoin utilization deacetylase AcuC-like enzyme
MTLLYYDPRMLDHETGAHPENGGRITAIADLFSLQNAWDRVTRPSWTPLTTSQAAKVHDPDYLEAIADLAARGGGNADADTVVSPASFDVALLAAGAAVEATRQVLSGGDSQAFCLIRPPGHHALKDRAMGFCLLNNVAIAAQVALDEFGLDRVLIVDFDVHHGNGTQDLFYDSSRIAYFSAHRHPFYPGTGLADETGMGDGLGATRNLPIAMGTSRDRYLSEVTRNLGDFADRVKPQLLLVSAGFDAHALDPVGSLGLETEDFEPLTCALLDVAAAHCNHRLVSVLEGGYNPPILAECVVLHLETMHQRQAEMTG